MSDYRACTTAIEIYDSVDNLIAKLEVFDECCATVEIESAFTAESWKELAEQVYQSLLSMNLETNQK